MKTNDRRRDKHSAVGVEATTFTSAAGASRALKSIADEQATGREARDEVAYLPKFSTPPLRSVTNSDANPAKDPSHEVTKIAFSSE